MKYKHSLRLSATVIVGSIFLGCLAFWGCAGPLSKDKDVRLFYFANKPALEKVLEMLEQDRVLNQTVINSKEIKGPSFDQGDVGLIDALVNTNILVNLNLDAARKMDYERTFAELPNIRGAFIYKNTGRVYFFMATSGLVISGGSYKGIAYVPRPADYPSNAITSSLDGRKADDLDGTFLVPIEGSWYIYYDCTK